MNKRLIIFLSLFFLVNLSFSQYKARLSHSRAIVDDNGGPYIATWYDTTGVFKQYIEPIFIDSTIVQSFEIHNQTPVTCHGVAAVLDPKSSKFGQYAFKDQKYKIDSVHIEAYYVIRKPQFHDTIVLELVYGDPYDTLGPFRMTYSLSYNQLTNKYDTVRRFAAPKYKGSPEHKKIIGLNYDKKLVFKKVIGVEDIIYGDEIHKRFDFYVGGIEVPANNIVAAFFYFSPGDTTYEYLDLYHAHDDAHISQSMNSFSPHVWQQYDININNPIPYFYDKTSYGLSYNAYARNRYSNWEEGSILNEILYPELYIGFFIDFSVSGNFYEPLVNDNLLSKDKTICLGDSVLIEARDAETYSWSTGEKTKSIKVAPISTMTYSVTLTVGNTSATDMIKITVNRFKADAGEDQTICSGGKAMLEAKGGEKYAWSNYKTTNVIVVNPAQTTTYIVTVTNGNCKDIDSVVVVVGNSIVPILDYDKTICEGGSVTINALGGEQYTWDNGSTSSYKSSIIVSPLQTTNYYLTITSGSCSATAMATVNVGLSIQAYAGNDITVVKGDSVHLKATGGNEFEWSTGATTQTINFIPTKTKTYTVTVYSGSCSATDDVVVVVIDPLYVGDEIEHNDAQYIIYPNPANGMIHIKANIAGNKNIEIYNIAGKVVKTLNSLQMEDVINVGDLESGIYFIKIINQNKVYVKKMIINK